MNLCLAGWTVVLALALPAVDSWAQTATVGGHAKYQFVHQSWPDDSIFRDLLGSSSTNQYLESRLKLDFEDGPWDFKADYQFLAIDADSLSLSEGLPGAPLPLDAVISDQRRWWN